MSADKGNQWYDGDWEELVDRAEEILAEVARRPARGREKDFTFYSELNEALGDPFELGNWRGQNGMSVLLAEVSRRSYADRKVMLSAVVLSKSGGMPGAGFFKLARDLRRMSSGEEDIKFFLEEVDRVRDAYREG
ncbi:MULTISPECIES: hypothetical protein [unclassified Dietzia]|uniref:hypothetical protein n=1 Tax=unclassified Dietzia TaxID=2617939 RepID=UPI000D205CF2|nr:MULTISPECIES: hypothetical protein [unclassified Dietzia]AVZ39271.1 hypothetical protein CT688_07080 [Dietzia sp. JS16-p6b]QGW24512.1 hypothetical protein GJR88_02275 [Dietzia sp. DQ12-45-1b]